MPIHRLLFIFWIALLGLQACQQQPPESFGALTATDADLTNASLDTLNVDASTIQIDSVSTGNIGFIQIGMVNHPIFGKISTVSPVEIRPNIGANPDPIQAIDSVMLSMTINRLSGDTTKDLVVDIFMSDSFPQLTVPYKSLQPVAYNPTRKIGNFVLGGTGYRIGSKTTIKTNASFLLAGLLKQYADSFDYLKPEKLSRLLKGIVFVPQSGNQIITIDMSSYSMVMHYKNTDGVSRSYIFSLGPASGHWTYIKSDRAGTAYASLVKTNDILPTSISNDSTILIQGGSGLRGLIKVPALTNYYTKLTSSIGPITLLRAELVMPIKLTEVVNYNNKPFLYFLLQGSDINRPSDFIYNENRRSNPSGFSQFNFNSADTVIKADITSYVQRVFKGQVQNKGILVYLGESDITTNFVRISNTKAGRGIRLKLYYIKQP